MLRRYLFGLIAVLALGSCTEELTDTPEAPTNSEAESADDGKEDDATGGDVSIFRWVNTWDRWTTQALDPCGYNDASQVGTYDVAAFDASAVMAEIRATDDLCEEGRTYSRSRANGVELFLRHIAEDSMTADCWSVQVSSYQQERAHSIINDPDNLGVFASLFPEGGADPEYCMYYHFYIFRPDGTLLRWTFSYVD